MALTAGPEGAQPVVDPPVVDTTESLQLVFRDLRGSALGLTGRDAARRLIADGPNELTRRGRPQWPRELLAQFTAPLALLLLAAAVLAMVSGSVPLAFAILAVIVLNAVFAFFQERHAEHAVEALAAYLPAQARVLRDGTATNIAASTLVPGDILLVEEGDRISADARLISGTADVDLSTLTGESQPVTRSTDGGDADVDLLAAANMLFSGSACIAGQARAIVTATGMRTQIGRIAALSERVGTESSPLERQVNKVAKLIAIVSIAVAAAFLPLGLAAGLSTGAAISFAIGMLVANVPEGLLPTITLALAAGVQNLARRGAVVKRLSAVETLGSTTVICTDKTGTLTQNRMQVTDLWTTTAAATVDDSGQFHWPATTAGPVDRPADPRAERRRDLLADLLVSTAASCCTAAVTSDDATGDPTEIALLQLSAAHHPDPTPNLPEARKALFRFDPRLRLMSTIESDPDTAALWVQTKGAPEAVLGRCTTVAIAVGESRELDGSEQARLADGIEVYGRRGLRLIAVARRPLGPGQAVPTDRTVAETGLCLLGMIAMLDPPRPQTEDAIARAHRAGIRVLVVTGDNGITATEIARQVGIGTGPGGGATITGTDLDAMTDPQLDDVLQGSTEIVFARSSPEAKLRIADTLRSLGEVVAMTGDGVNDAPALRAADIGVAMGRSGTEVARQAATMVLTDDNFATVIDAVEEGRRIYDNVRKFILYIFAHAVPEIVPFMVFALSGGAVPLPLTVMQLLAIDLLTDTLPALALSREPAEPGTMSRPPRPKGEGVIRWSLLARAWGFLGLISAVLVLAGFFYVLHQGGWHLHAATGEGLPLHHLYQQATTVAWLGIVACQVGTAFAARTDRASLRRIGLTSNPLLLGAIAVELVLAAALVYLPWLHAVFGTAALDPGQLVVVLPFPFIVWGADEIRRAIQRRRHPDVNPATTGPSTGTPDRSPVHGSPVDRSPVDRSPIDRSPIDRRSIETSPAAVGSTLSESSSA